MARSPKGEGQDRPRNILEGKKCRGAPKARSPKGEGQDGLRNTVGPPRSAAQPRKQSGTSSQRIGEVAERSNAAVLKTVGPPGPGGSNPSLSAKR